MHDTVKLDDPNGMRIIEVKDTIDLMVQAGEDQYPVMASTLVKVHVASWKELEEFEAAGHIRSITIDVPSVLMLGKTVQEKAYYTMRRVPELVKNTLGGERLQ